MVVMTDTTPAADLQPGSMILARPDGWSVILCHRPEGWGLPNWKNVATHRFISGEELTALVDGGDVIVIYNPDADCDRCGGAGTAAASPTTPAGPVCWGCSGTGKSSPDAWHVQNPGMCGGCGGVGLEYVPGLGFNGHTCEGCNGTGENSEHQAGRFLDWLDEDPTRGKA